MNGCDGAYFFRRIFSEAKSHDCFTHEMKLFAGRQIRCGSAVREGFARARGIREETRGEEGSGR